MNNRAPPSPPPQPPELPPAAVPVPQRRRRSARNARGGPIPIRQAAAILVVVPHRRRQIPAPPAAAAGDGPADADYDNLMLLADTALSQADAEAEAEALSPPAPAPAGKKRRLRLRYSQSSLPPPPAAEEDQQKEIPNAPPLLPPPPAAAEDQEKDKPNAPPLLPPLAAVDMDEPQSSSLSSSMGGHGHHAAAEATALGDSSKEAAACPQPQANDDAGSSQADEHGGGGVASPAADAAASPEPQPADDDDYELEPGEIPPEKPAAGRRRNADSTAAHESLLGKYKYAETAAAVVGRDGKGKAAAETEMSAAEKKRKREVFVGGLCRDAMEWDVRAALSVAGEITQVRMIVDRATSKNKGYCFVAYRDAAMASRAVAEFSNVKICGKPCRLAVPEGDQKASNTAQRDPIIEDYKHIYEQGQHSPTHASYITSCWDHHDSYVVPPVAIPSGAGYYYSMYQNGKLVYLPPPDLNHGLAGPSGRSHQMGQSGPSRSSTGNPRRNRN